MASHELVKLQLAWLEQGMDEYETQIRLQSYLDAGFDPEMAAAAVNVELYQDQMAALRERVEQLEQAVAVLAAQLAKTHRDA